MLTLTRRRGEYVDAIEENDGKHLRIRLLDFDLHGADIRFEDAKTGNVLNTYRIAIRNGEIDGKEFGVGVACFGHAKRSNALQLGFDAPRSIHLLRDNIKDTRPPAAARETGT